MLAMSLPEKEINITIEIMPIPNLAKSVRDQLLFDVEQYIRCVFRENQAYENTIKTWPQSLFSFSTLNQALRNNFTQIETLYFSNRDFRSSFEIARINTLSIIDTGPANA